MGNNIENRLTQQEIDTHLKEYEALRAEVRQCTQRIDRYIGIYLAASFAVVAALLRPGADYSISSYFEKIEQCNVSDKSRVKRC